MKIAQVIGGLTPGESDKLRKAIFKDDVITLGAMEKKFVQTALEKGYAKKNIKKAWMEMTLNGRGTFNKSHAVCYTWIAYQMGYLKAHYPEVFKKVMDAYGS
jgi:DNA polymerase-3 subunit alpha